VDDKLIEFIQKIHKKGHSFEEINIFLRNKGYSQEQIEEIIKNIEPHHIKKTIIIEIPVLIFVVLIAFFFIGSLAKPPVCIQSLDCDDFLAETVDVCINANTKESYCVYSQKEIFDSFVMRKAIEENATTSFEIQNEFHSIYISEISLDASVKMQIFSKPIYVKLFIGEFVQIDLNKDEFNDIEIKLDKIENDKAYFTIKNLAKINDLNLNMDILIDKSKILNSNNLLGSIELKSEFKPFKGLILYDYLINGTNQTFVYYSDIYSNSTFDIYDIETNNSKIQKLINLNEDYDLSISIYSCELLSIEGKNCLNINLNELSSITPIKSVVKTFDKHIAVQNIDESLVDLTQPSSFVGSSGGSGGGGGGGSSSSTDEEEPELDITSPQVYLLSHRNITYDDIYYNNSTIDRYNLVITFSEKMNLNINPSIIFNPNLDFILSNCSQSWISDYSHKLSCDISQVFTISNNHILSITNAKDLAGNLMTNYFYNDFDVNTIETTIPTIKSFTSSTNFIDDSLKGSKKFNLSIEFSEEMKKTNLSFSYSPYVDIINNQLDVDDILSNCTLTWNLTNATYSCDVSLEGVTANDIDVTLLEAQDLSGNKITNYKKENLFSINVSYYEPVVFAINKNYVDFFPDWQERMDNAIDYINDVYGKTSKKRFEIKKYMVYEDMDYENTWDDPDYFYPWKGRSTTTIVLYMNNRTMNTTELDVFNPSRTRNAATTKYLNGITYQLIILMQDSHIYSNMLNLAEGAMQLPIHELGHTSGLAFPDQYLYTFIDCTNASPKLSNYDIRAIYPNDPMVQGSSSNYQFHYFNSYVLNYNLNHRYDFIGIRNLHAKISKVYVTDGDNNPISGAKVDVYCIKKNCFYCYSKCNGVHGVSNSTIPLQTLYTDSTGYVTYTGASGNWGMNEDVNTECLVKAVKASYNNKTAGKYVQFIDLQHDYFFNDSNIHIDHLVLE
jgi:hypothetical protein